MQAETVPDFSSLLSLPLSPLAELVPSPSGTQGPSWWSWVRGQSHRDRGTCPVLEGCAQGGSDEQLRDSNLHFCLDHSHRAGRTPKSKTSLKRVWAEDGEDGMGMAPVFPVKGYC